MRYLEQRGGQGFRRGDGERSAGMPRDKSQYGGRRRKTATTTTAYAPWMLMLSQRTESPTAGSCVLCGISSPQNRGCGWNKLLRSSGSRFDLVRVSTFIKSLCCFRYNHVCRSLCFALAWRMVDAPPRPWKSESKSRYKIYHIHKRGRAKVAVPFRICFILLYLHLPVGHTRFEECCAMGTRGKLCLF